MSFANGALPHLKRRYENAMVVVLRLSIAAVFIWFGLLKVFGWNPVFDLVNSVLPFMAAGPGLLALGCFETAIGAGLLINRWRRVTHLLLLLHLCGTFLTFVTAPEIVFNPAFPILSLAGEFVLKNLVLAIAGLVVLLHESHRRRAS